MYYIKMEGLEKSSPICFEKISRLRFIVTCFGTSRAMKFKTLEDAKKAYLGIKETSAYDWLISEE